MCATLSQHELGRESRRRLYEKERTHCIDAFGKQFSTARAGEVNEITSFGSGWIGVEIRCPALGAVGKHRERVTHTHTHTHEHGQQKATEFAEKECGLNNTLRKSTCVVYIQLHITPRTYLTFLMKISSSAPLKPSPTVNPCPGEGASNRGCKSYTESSLWWLCNVCSRRRRVEGNVEAPSILPSTKIFAVLLVALYVALTTWCAGTVVVNGVVLMAVTVPCVVVTDHRSRRPLLLSSPAKPQFATTTHSYAALSFAHPLNMCQMA